MSLFRLFSSRGDLEGGNLSQTDQNLARFCREVLGHEENANLLPNESLFLRHFMESIIRGLAPLYLSEFANQLGEEDGDKGYFNVALQVAGIIRGKRDPNLTIDDIVHELCSMRQKEHLLQIEDNQLLMRQSVFAILGLLTTLFTPSTIETDGISFNIHNYGNRFQVSRGPLTLAGRRLYGFLRAFGDLMPPLPTAALTKVEENFDDALHVSRLNYNSLYHIGHIEVMWTDNLSFHLHFDSNTRTLYIFRCPSFCVLNCSALSSQSVYNCVLSEYNQAFYKSNKIQAPRPMVSQSLLCEVLQSYRLLFADASSRKLFTSTIKELAKVGKAVDPVLLQICEKQPPSSKNPAAAPWDIQIRDVYHAKDSFPLLGERFLALQRHNSQDPSTVRRMLQDRRHPLEFVNLKVVIMFGVINLLFAFLQLIIGALQLAYAVKQSDSSGLK